jgi:hypothetical protein
LDQSWTWTPLEKRRGNLVAAHDDEHLDRLVLKKDGNSDTRLYN